jgi:hypothetical protein
MADEHPTNVATLGRRGSVVVATSFRFGHLTRDVGLLSPGIGF